MSILRNRLLLSAALSVVLWGGCGPKDEPPPTSKGPVVPKALKERSTKAQVERLAQASIDIINLADSKSDLSAQQRDNILMGLFVDYMDDAPKAGETTTDKYYERLCTTSMKADCEGIFPENYKTVFFRVILTKLDEALQALKPELANANLKETQLTILSKEPSFFAEALTATKVSKGDRNAFAFIDHPIPLPDRNSAVNTKIGIDDKGNVIIIVSGERAPDSSFKGEGKAPDFKVILPIGPAPATPPSFDNIVKELTDLRLLWEDFAKKEAVAKQEGKIPPGTPGYEVDGYIEIQIAPTAPAWYLAWAIQACERAGYANPVMVVRANGELARLGMIPFPLNKEFKDVLNEPIKVKKGGETTKPSKELKGDLLATIYPEDGATLQDIAKALDTLGGCKDNPCSFFPNLLVVERWKLD
jgi:hypothetical protein